MVNLLKQMRTQNQALENQLTTRNQKILSDFYMDIYSAQVKECHMEGIRKQMNEYALTVQKENGDLTNAFDETKKQVYLKQVSMLPKKTMYESFLENTVIFLVGVFILFLLELLVSSAWTGFLKGDFLVNITLGFVISTVLIMALTMVIFRILTANAFDLTQKNNFPKSVFIGGFTLSFFVILLTQYFLKGIVLFEVNGLLVMGLLLVLAFVCKKVETIEINQEIKKINEQ